jgi:hypothetical protein
MGARAKNRENSSLLAKWCPLSTLQKRIFPRAEFCGSTSARISRTPFLRGEKPVGSELWTASLPRGLTGRSKGENAFSKPDPVNLNPKS